MGNAEVKIIGIHISGILQSKIILKANEDFEELYAAGYRLTERRIFDNDLDSTMYFIFEKKQGEDKK